MNGAVDDLEIKRERILDSIRKRRTAGKDLGGRRQTITDSQIRSALCLIDAGEPTAQVARDLGMFPATLYRRARWLNRSDTVAHANQL